MWVIANGAPKTGSTWLIQLIKGTKRFKRIPRELQDEKWKNPSVKDALVDKNAIDLASSDIRYMSKQHWAETNKDLLQISGIKIFNSIRDIRDTLVSRYHHDVRLNNEKLSISDYISKKGPQLVYAFCLYQKYWIDAAQRSPSAYHIESYERLSQDSEAGAREMYEFCGLDLSDEELNAAVESASFTKRNTGPGQFFRKGRVHAFGDDISESEVEFIMSLAEKEQLRSIKNEIAEYNPALKPYLKMTDVGL